MTRTTRQTLTACACAALLAAVAVPPAPAAPDQAASPSMHPRLAARAAPAPAIDPALVSPSSAPRRDTRIARPDPGAADGPFARSSLRRDARFTLVSVDDREAMMPL